MSNLAWGFELYRANIIPNNLINYREQKYRGCSTNPPPSVERGSSSIFTVFRMTATLQPCAKRLMIAQHRFDGGWLCTSAVQPATIDAFRRVQERETAQGKVSCYFLK